MSQADWTEQCFKGIKDSFKCLYSTPLFKPHRDHDVITKWLRVKDLNVDG